MFTVDVFSDVVCPWCFIGLTRLDRVLATLDTPVEVVHHPFLLQPDAPPEGTDIQAMLRKKYGADPRQLFATVEAAAKESGLALDLGQQRYSYPTVAAHTLLRHAGPKGTQRALARRLFEAYFIEARNIAQVATLQEIAAAHGFAADEVARILADPAELAETRREAALAAERGIRGVPFFVVGGKLTLSGAQPEARFHAAIREAQAAHGE
jgi:predicted DsbA family dithiol-disulfide isomerase